MSKWIKFTLGRSNEGGKQLILRNCLVNGQCFNWYQIKEHDYVGVLYSYIIRIKQDMDTYAIQYCYKALDNDKEKKKTSSKEIQELLIDYFQLKEVDLVELYKEWSKDTYFSTIGPYLPGLRILRQDPLECTISFLVSQNNNITRITNLLKKIRSNYGTKIGSIHDVLDEDEEIGDFTIIDFYTFPTLDKLSSVSETELQSLCLGYRAGYIAASVKTIQKNGGEEWIRGLRYQIKNIKKESNEEESKEDLSDNQDEHLKVSRESLLILKGVGKKVADCISLFSMNCDGSIPVDTHVHQIANRVYGKSSKEKSSMTNEVYNSVVKIFKHNFGNYCGWAHSVLFAAELPRYKEVIEKQKNKEEPSKRKHKEIEVEYGDKSDELPFAKRQIKSSS